MKTFLAIIGGFVLACFVLGMLGAVDFVLCVKAPGQCSNVMDVKYETI